MCSRAVPSTPKRLLPDPKVASQSLAWSSSPQPPCRPCTRWGGPVLGVMLWDCDEIGPSWLLSRRLALSGESCSRLLRVLSQHKQLHAGWRGGLKRTCVWRVSCLASLCRPGGSLRIPVCHRHRGRIPSPSVDSFYFYGKCLHWTSCSAAVKGSLPLFPARLSDLPFASLLFSWSFSGWPSELKCLGSFVCVVCLWFIYFFINPSPLAMTET